MSWWSGRSWTNSSLPFRKRLSYSHPLFPALGVDTRDSLTEFFPPAPHPRSALKNPTTGALQSDAAYKRQAAFLDKAEQAGHTVIRGETDEAKRRMGISLVIMKNGVKEGDQIMNPTEEIFGPVLPIIPVDVRNSNSLLNELC